MTERKDSKKILEEIMKELEKYIIRKDHNAFNKAQLKYFSYLKEGGKKNF